MIALGTEDSGDIGGLGGLVFDLGEQNIADTENLVKRTSIFNIKIKIKVET